MFFHKSRDCSGGIMSNLLTEQNVLRKLGIEDFRQLNKEKSIHFISMLDKMEPEVAKTALEQFPEFSIISKEILLGYKNTLDKGIESNNASIKRVYDNYNAIILSLQKELERTDLSFDEKVYIFEQMKDIACKIDNKDSENKKWMKGMAVVGGVIALAGIAVLGVAVGGAFAAKTPDIDPPDPEPDLDPAVDVDLDPVVDNFDNII